MHKYGTKSFQELMRSWRKLLHSKCYRLYVMAKQRTFEGRLHYIKECNGSKMLLVVFPAFGDKPSYNYIRTLMKIKVDKLFILDDFGYRGSYLWFENGIDLPRDLVNRLIAKEIRGGGYTDVRMMGTSKGGTCAIYWGLEFNASHVYAGSCQYYIGKYLNTPWHKKIFLAMMGGKAGYKEELLLDSFLPNQIIAHKESTTKIHLLYSKEERYAYEEHIRYLVDDLKENDIDVIETLEHFERHEDIGVLFKPYIKKELEGIS